MLDPAVIENLYTTFNTYSPQGIHHCDCGCINEEDVKRLASKVLRELGLEELSPYHGSALYTWGDLKHYKYYLPRIFELYSQKREIALIDLYDIHNKLDYAKWLEWEASEVKAIKEYILADWTDFVNHHVCESSAMEIENYVNFFPIETLIKHWKINTHDAALKNFVRFFFYNGTAIFNDQFKINGTKNNKALADLIYTAQLAEQLTALFFKTEKTDNEFAAQVSIVLQMVEQQLNVQ